MYQYSIVHFDKSYTAEESEDRLPNFGKLVANR